MSVLGYTGKLRLVVPSALLAVLFILAGTLPINGLWGFNHIKYLPGYSVFIYILLFLLILIPGSAERLYLLLSRITAVFKRLPKAIQLLLIVLFSVAVFHFLRVHVHSLGDGYQRIYQIEQGYAYYHTEPLDFFLHAILYRALKVVGVVSGELTYTLFSIIGGVAFISAVYLFRFPQQRDSQIGGLIKLLIISLGGLQLFFGYVESYSLYYIFSLLYLLFAARYILSNQGLLMTSVMLAFGLASHLTALILLPSFLYLIYYNFKYCRPERFAPRYLPIIIVLLPALGLLGQEIWLRIYVAEYVPSISGGILPLFSDSEYSIFSLAHLFDILNEILLISPLSLVLAAYLLLNRKCYTHTKSLSAFLSIIVVFSFLMLLTIDPKLGLARDWDLFSIPAAALGSAIVLLLLTKANKNTVGSYTTIVLGALSIVFLSAWILTNSSEKRQLVRAEDLLSSSDKSRGYSTELLAYYYRHEARNSKKALELLKSITGQALNARVYNKIAKAEIDLGLYDDALKSICKGLELDSNFAELYLMAGVTWVRMDKPELGLPYLLKARYLEPTRYNIYHSLGNTYYRLDSLEKAVMAFKKTINLKPDFAMAYIETGNMYRLMQHYDSALAYVQMGLRLNPNSAEGYQLLDLIKKEWTSQTGR